MKWDISFLERILWHELHILCAMFEICQHNGGIIMRQEIGEKITIWDANRIQYGDSDNPHKVLGRHMVSSGQVISAFHPGAVV